MQPYALNPIEPGATLGVIGGGQLGRMFVQAAQRMGYTTVVLDESADSPAGTISQHHIRTGYTDENGLEQLAQLCDCATTEFENVPARSLEILGDKIPVAPGAQAVAICQDRAQEKEHFRQSGVPYAPYTVINSASELSRSNPRLFPGILKTARLGYDGKGQASVASAAQLASAWDELGRVPCVLEKKLPLSFEISVIVARSYSGQCVRFPVQRNLHREGILAVTEASWEPRWLPASLQEEALSAAEKIARSMNYVGVMCVEFFVLDNNTLVANEIAPRPHNSGHWTIEGCSYSQFEAQIRALTGLPLPMVKQRSSAIMLNLLGDLWFDAYGQEQTPPWHKILELPDVHLHLYGKTHPRKGRKMGHLTVTAAGLKVAKDNALKAAAILGIEPW